MPNQQPPVEYRSQWRQDRFIHENLMPHRGGTFFEAGAHDAYTISNTWFFEKALDWRGVLVEMQPQLFAKIVERRPNSQCFRCALGTQPIDLMYLEAGDRSSLMRYMPHGDIEYLERHYASKPDKPTFRVGWVAVRPVSDVLTEAGVTHIDYFSLDVEGAEMDVLRSIDFSKVTIDLFTIEDNAGKWTEPRALLEPRGYELIGALGVDALFAHRRLMDRIAAERGTAHVAAVRSGLRRIA
ncbi:FkbM family methyltransferase [Limobrevibacterium gyesilva]|uniref:FkbM family methyltransferase n=1 Tax=Limobrevibacterium gyesilva TaxID=2991712 RepID=A0AA41YS97_9PROT|nr:FkbM family methyltransferase [Limobrevibacterium gyesilva]MCW3475585.1 FkbM family methyltransferase [Limobrevibacterium gyesilva]